PPGARHSVAGSGGSGATLPGAAREAPAFRRGESSPRPSLGACLVAGPRQCPRPAARRACRSCAKRTDLTRRVCLTMADNVTAGLIHRRNGGLISQEVTTREREGELRRCRWARG